MSESAHRGIGDPVRLFVALSISDAALAVDDRDDFLPWPVSTDVQATGALPMALAAASSHFIRAHKASRIRLIVLNACLASGRTLEVSLPDLADLATSLILIGCLARSSCEQHGSRILRLPPFGGHGPHLRCDDRSTGQEEEPFSGVRRRLEPPYSPNPSPIRPILCPSDA